MPDTPAVDGTIANLPRYENNRPAPPSNEVTKDMFLKLMVAQLKYQNPLSPLDSNEYLNQTATFQMVEQLQKLTEQNTSTVLAQKLSTASSLVGRQVTYPGANGLDAKGVVNAARISVEGKIVLSVGEADVPIETVTAVAPAPPVATQTTS